MLPGAPVRSGLVARLRRSALFIAYKEAFEATTGLPLVLREPGCFRPPMEGSVKTNEFCSRMTAHNKTCSACLQVQGQLEAEATLEPKTSRCYAGLHESAVPVRLGHTVVGYLQTGQIFFTSPGPRQFAAVAKAMGITTEPALRRELESSYHRSRVVTRVQYDAVLRLLAIFAEHLSSVSNQIWMAGTHSDPLAVTRGRSYIAEHFREEMALSDVARAVRMSACYFCRIFRAATGMTFTDYLARERVEAVKRMLRDANTRVSEAAFAAGFQSLSQFNRVFHRIEGEAPRSYRERITGMEQTGERPVAGFNAA